MPVELTKNRIPAGILWQDGYRPWTYDPYVYVDSWYLPGHLTPSQAVAVMRSRGIGAIHGGTEHVWIMPVWHDDECWATHLADVRDGYEPPASPHDFDEEHFANCGWRTDNVPTGTVGAIAATILTDGHALDEDIPSITPPKPIPGQIEIPA